MRKCKICKQEKEDYKFDQRDKGPFAQRYFDKVCRVCRHEKQKEHRADQKLECLYGITRAQWELILKSQDGKCKLCGVEFDGTVQIDVDHDHKTHVVRGLLCTKCNRGLGVFEDDPERLRIAANYLETANALKELYKSKHS